MKRAALGRAGERKAARYLRRRGLRLLERNWRCSAGELDLVMQEGSTVVIVEVRTSQAGFADGAVHTVGPDKRQRLTRLAQIWLQGCREEPHSLRFDVVAVHRRGWLNWTVDWYRDAFQA